MNKVLVLLLSLIVMTSAHAARWKYDFTTSFFFPATDPIPHDPVSGSVIIETLDDDPLIPKRLVGIDLTINGHAYSLSEIAANPWEPAYPSRISFGGSINGVLGFQSGTDDFLLTFYLFENYPTEFIYTSASAPGAWVASMFSSTRTIEAVPEASTSLLALGGLAFVVAYNRARGGRQSTSSSAQGQNDI